MQFTRLRLQGFKSFVDPAELVLAPGLTGIVGPNGCGKSNLLEALRWVMGETRPTAMRGEGMEDVIFNGSAARPPRSSAVVELVIDNAERRAPLPFNNDDVIEVARRITRDIGSAFTINGRSVRARDVQRLFADASSGAHSPALVRQGQIAELINAKPTARRRILEEAAGIAGLYQRRHEAELKLGATETNLGRVAEVVEQLEAQLRTLERQAAQARRYRAIGEELRRAEALLLWLRWQGAAAEQRAAESALAEATRATAEAERAVQAARRAREAAEAELPPRREEAAIAAALCQRLGIEREQLAEREMRAEAELVTLAARLRQLELDREREESLERDASQSLAALAAEEERLRQAQAGHGAREEKARAAERAAAERLAAEEDALDRLTETAARLVARAAAAERRREEARAALARIEREIGEAEAEAATLAARREEAAATLAAARAAHEAAEREARAAEAALGEAEAARAAAQAAEAEARARAGEIEGRVAALGAEVDALDRLLAAEAGEVASLVDRVAAEPGFEAALGAALGDDLRAAEVAAGEDASGWRTLPPLEDAPPLPEGAAPLAARVRAPAVLARRLAQVGIVEQATGDALQAALAPGQRLVSREGDLWRWDGFRLRAGDAPSATALRLARRNRRAALVEELTAGKAALAEARATLERARAALRDALSEEVAARERRRRADGALADAARALSRAEAELELVGGRIESRRHALELRTAERETLAAALAEAEAALAEVGDVAAARARVEEQRRTVDAARSAMLAARGEAEEVRRAGAGREKRLAAIARERQGWQERLASAAGRMSEIERRLAESRAAREEAEKQPALLAERRTRLAAEIEAAEARRRRADDALAEAESALRAAETAEREAVAAATARREARARLEARLEAASARLDEAAARIREALDIEPDALAGMVGLEDGAALPDPERVEADVARLRRQRDALGAVNLRAEADAAEVAAEHERLVAEKADLEAAIAKLRSGIAELNREGRQRLQQAFDQVNAGFARLFRHLFGGGEARLVMVESEDPLEAGLEILCQPPGKKLSTLSLLSGGEQTLTAISLIFAVFLANPAPICVLDEVDAPLDDANVTRFCNLLDEMVRLTGTRFLIITHHAITMSRMDRLFGVTMLEPGVSRLVSVDLARAAELAEA